MTATPEMRLAPRGAQPRPATQAYPEPDRGITTARLLDELHHTDDEREKAALRAEVVVLNMGVARAIAHRYRQRGLADDDLQQVACLALVKAAQGFYTLPTSWTSWPTPSRRSGARSSATSATTAGWSARPAASRSSRPASGWPRAELASRARALALASRRSPPSSTCPRSRTSPKALATDGCFHADVAGPSRSAPVDDSSLPGGAAEGGTTPPAGRRRGTRRARGAGDSAGSGSGTGGSCLLRFVRGWTQRVDRAATSGSPRCRSPGCSAAEFLLDLRAELT